MKRTEPLLLGITGAFGSGKSTAAAFFAARGFRIIRLSSYLEEELKKHQKGTITRKMLQDAGNTLREREGAGSLAKKALQQIEGEKLKQVVIDGIRNVAEVEELYTNPNFVLMAIVADRQVRLERLQKNPRRETLDAKTFAQLEYRDLGVGEKETGLQVGMCIALADVFVENNGIEEALEEKLTPYLDERTV